MILTPDNEYSAVLDACVLVPMPLCDTLLRLAEEPAFYRPLWSEQILLELGNTLVNRLKYTDQQRDRRIKVMREHFPEAIVNIPATLMSALSCLPDKNDCHVLAAAIRGGANAIVTHNIRHFPQSCLTDYELLCQTPDEFLLHQFYLAPEQVLEKLDAQASAIGEQRTQVLQRLKRSAPNFAATIEQFNR